MLLRHVNPCIRSCIRLTGSRFYSTALRMTTKSVSSTVGVPRLIRHNVVATCVSGFHRSHNMFSDIVTIVTPPFVESVSEGDVFFEKELGTHVKVDEQIAHIETDKITLPVVSPVDGVIDSFLVAPGTRVTPGAPIIQIDVSPRKPEAPTTFKFEKSLYFEPKPDPKHQKKLVAEHRNEIADEVPEIVKSEYTGSGKERRVKMSRMRMKIAERLKESQNIAATLTTLNEIDMSYLISIRKLYGEEFSKKYGIKLGFMSSFVKACVYAIQDQPVMNAYIEGNEIVYRDNIDVGVAVASPKGLVVPIIRNAEKLNYSEIENAIHDLGTKARDGRLIIEDMQGGTFTISNGGIFGGLFGTPIINHSQSAILGMYSIKERPVAINGEVVIRPMMYVALSYDHRLIDGREAVTFLSKIKRYIENPIVSLLGL